MSDEQEIRVIANLKELYEKLLLNAISRSRELNLTRPEEEDFIPPPRVRLTHVYNSKEGAKGPSFYIVVVDCYLPKDTGHLDSLVCKIAYVDLEEKKLVVNYPKREDLVRLARGFSAGFVIYQEGKPRVNFLQLIAIAQGQTPVINPSLTMPIEDERYFLRLAGIVDLQIVRAFEERIPPLLGLKLNHHGFVFDTFQFEKGFFPFELFNLGPRPAVPLQDLPSSRPLNSIFIAPQDGTLYQTTI